MEVEENVEGTEEQVDVIEETHEQTTEETTPSQEEVTEPVYEPNYSYKVYDEEREFDEWAKAALKAEGLSNKETEQALRDLYARSGAFERQKKEYGELRDKHKTLKSDNSQLNDEVQELLYYADNEFGTFLNRLKIPKEKVFDYVQQQIEEEKLDPTQRARLQANRQAIVQSYESRREADRLRSQNEELNQSTFMMQLDHALNSPEVASYRQAFDKAYGADAFKNEALNVGRLYHLDNGHDTTPLAAILKTVDKYRKLGIDFSANRQATSLESARKKQESGKPGGHIENVGAGSISHSPAKRQAKDIDSLKKIVAERLEELRG
jgi:hypothetical protein